METFGVGTLNAIPFNLPFNCGKTNATALAAPVEVGTMFNASGRARLKSLCEASKSLVTSVGVSGGHGTLDDAEVFVQNLGERRQAVGGARGVGDNVGSRVKLVRVDANGVGRDVVTLGRGRETTFLAPAVKCLPAPGHRERHRYLR